METDKVGKEEITSDRIMSLPDREIFPLDNRKAPKSSRKAPQDSLK